jgi:radical SAM superfamily enzyme YgiQ (UPF0313 family)
MSGTVEALLTIDDSEKSVVGKRVAFSPYRLFRSDLKHIEKPQEFINFVSQFNYVVTDHQGSEFFLGLGINQEKIIEFPEWIISQKSVEECKNALDKRFLNVGKNSENTILNAMSRYSDRVKIDSILDSIKVTGQNFAHLLNFNLVHIPNFALVSVPTNIYPLEIPEINISEDQDFVVIDCPARNLSLLPNGIAYLEVALKKQRIRFEVLDVDLIAYHLFHMHRIYDLGSKVIESEVELPADPWLAHNYDSWSSLSEHENNGGGISAEQPIHHFFNFLLETVAREIVSSKPRALGFSIQQCSEVMSAKLISLAQSYGFTSPIIVGGFSCYNFDIGLRGFPLADYMCIGESETSIGLLLKEVLERGVAKDLPGVLGRYDTPNRVFTSAPMIHDLNTIEFPKYSWSDLKAYVNWDGYQLVPIIASRGCRWSRCTFCAERFYWRIRSAKDFVDELEWHVSKGHYLFMFNESDLNGMPERVLEICDEIIRRGLHKKVKLTGQLRIHRKSDRAFFQKLNLAGFVALRFGVDSFSRNGMKLQQKGYTPEIVAQNLKDCTESGIFVEVNWVIGVPGETEDDIEEGIQFILQNQKFIGRLANLNPLILVNGSVYWLNPAEYKISFKEEWEQLKQKYPRAIPAALWWSEEPYIDSAVRQKWFLKVVSELYKNGFPIGDWAKQVIDDVENKKDKVRSAGDTDSMATDYSSKQQLDLIPAEQKGLAQPPKSEEATLLEVYRGYSIYSSKGMFYATREETSSKFVIDLEISSLFKSSDFNNLKREIDDAIAWADTRGSYKGKETSMRADSNLIKPLDHNENEQYSNQILRIDSNHFLIIDESETQKKRFKEILPIRYCRKLEMKIMKRSRVTDLIEQIYLDAINIMAKPQTEFVQGHIEFISSSGAVPELIASWEDAKLNIVRFDGVFYALPHGIEVDFMNPKSRYLHLRNFESNARLGDLIKNLELRVTDSDSVSVFQD